MNAQAESVAVPLRSRRPRSALVLLGTGGVGQALLEQLRAHVHHDLVLAGVANSSRQLLAPRGIEGVDALSFLARQAPYRHDQELLDVLAASGATHRVVVDATASIEVARRHPAWLAAGFHVVTANKTLYGGALADWRAIGSAARAGGVRYGASATVGAGLPVLDTLRRWHVCGDGVTVIEGVFSGSLSWLFNHFDGSQPFSWLLARARNAGYCEPDPRQDLSGGDVLRKLLILARTAGIELQEDQVAVESLVPVALRDVSTQRFNAKIDLLDRDMARRQLEALQAGCVLRYLARLDSSGARIGLHKVQPGHPAAQLQGTDNLFALSSLCYRHQPLIIRGPGAGTRVTAQALLADIHQLIT